MDRTETAQRHRGSRRLGAGRPRNGTPRREPTVPLRIPFGLAASVRRRLKQDTRELTLIDMHQWNAPVSEA